MQRARVGTGGVAWLLGVAVLTGCAGGSGPAEPGPDMKDVAADGIAVDLSIAEAVEPPETRDDLGLDAAPEQGGDTTAPTVTFVQPLDGAEVEGVVAIFVDATDDSGVVSVELFVDGESLGTDEETPYEFQWDATKLWSGSYALKAVAVDDAGNSGEAEIGVTVLGECDETGDCPPTVAFDGPEAGALVRGLVEIQAAAGDDDAVVKVRFLVDDGLLVEDGQVPWKADWDTAEFDDGPHALEAVAFDTGGYSASATIEVVTDNTPPELALLSPEEGANSLGEVLFAAEASDDSEVERVEFSVDGGAPAVVEEAPWESTFDTSALASGAHAVTVTALDKVGNEAELTRGFLVDRPPVVEILSPAAGAVLPGETLVQAQAGDDLGLAGVALHVDDAWVGDLVEAGEGLFEGSWVPPYEKGERVLTAVATDGLGQEVAAAVTVLVDHPVTVALQLCEDGACAALEPDVELSDVAQIRAIAADDGAEIVGVEFLVDGEPAHQDLEAPFDFPWDTTTEDDGPHLLAAVATSGLEETGSAELQVQVENCSCPPGTGCFDGQCLDACEMLAPEWAGSSLGCAFRVVDLDLYDDPFAPVPPYEADYGVVVTNPGPGVATLSFSSDAAGVVFDVADVEVQPGGAATVVLPPMDLDGAGVTDRSVLLSSTQPVAAYLCNSLDLTAMYMADCSLLLPTARLGIEYFVLSYPTIPLEAMPMMPMPSQHGYLSVVAAEPGTTLVTVEPSAVTDAPDGATLQPGEEALFELSQGEVLSLQADGSALWVFQDLSGTRISATQPVAVFTGHEEAVVSPPSCIDEGCCAEHLEEQLLPVSAWGATVVCAKAPPRGPSDMDLWRIQGAAPGVVLATDPPVAGLHGEVLAAAGDWVEAFSAVSFVLTATGPIQAAQYLASQTCAEAFVGDPSMVMAVPAGRYRASYAIATPEGYSENLVAVVREAGAPVSLDGLLLDDAAFATIGDSAWEVGYITIQEGAHSLGGAAPFGLLQYGYSGPASYGCPGGMQLVADE